MPRSGLIYPRSIWPTKGEEVAFEAVRAEPPPGLMDGGHRIEDRSMLDGVLLSLHFVTGNKHTIEGSAVMVAPGIALTADHVLVDRRSALESGSTCLIAVTACSDQLCVWHVRRVSPVEGTDLAILALEYASDPPPGGRLRYASLTTRLPKQGERVMFAGYPPSAKAFEASPDGFNYDGQPILGAGQVLEVHPERRDRTFAPWPAVVVSCGAMGAMSGGPAFDCQGRVFGVLSSSFQAEDGMGPATMSLIYPALIKEIEPVWLTQIFGQRTSLLDLKHPLSDIERRDAVRVADHADGRTIALTHWS